MAQQFVSLPSVVEPEETRVEEKRETHAFFFEYMSRRAQKDQDLRADHADTIQKLRQEATEGVTDQTAIKVGSHLADLGDAIDAEVMELIELTTRNPETGFSTFFEVVKNIFEWDEQGGAKINLGRIAALMSYCYHLCKEYITKNLISGTLIASFLGQVAGWLFQFLLKAKFYEWLNSHGGWGQLIASATKGFAYWGTTALASAGVVYFAFLAYTYFRKS